MCLPRSNPSVLSKNTQAQVSKRRALIVFTGLVEPERQPESIAKYRLASRVLQEVTHMLQEGSGPIRLYEIIVFQEPTRSLLDPRLLPL